VTAAYIRLGLPEDVGIAYAVACSCVAAVTHFLFQGGPEPGERQSLEVLHRNRARWVEATGGTGAHRNVRDWKRKRPGEGRRIIYPGGHSQPVNEGRHKVARWV